MITLMDQTLDKRPEAGARLLKLAEMTPLGENMKAGSFYGFELRIKRGDMLGAATLQISGAGTYAVDMGESALGNIQRLENQLERLAPSVKAADCKIDALKQEQQTLEADAEQPFPQEAELTEKSQRLIALDAALKLKTHADRVQDTEIDQEDTPSQAREEYVR